MKMKRITAVLIAILLCLSSSALAVELIGGNHITVHDGDTITGIIPAGSEHVSCRVHVVGSGDVTLTLDEVSIGNGSLDFVPQDSVTGITLNLKGENRFVTIDDPDDPAYSQDPSLNVWNAVPVTIQDGGNGSLVGGHDSGPFLATRGEIVIKSGKIKAGGAIGIETYGSLTIKDGTIEIECSDVGLAALQDLRIYGGNIRSKSKICGALVCGETSILNGKLALHGDTCALLNISVPESGSIDLLTPVTSSSYAFRGWKVNDDVMNAGESVDCNQTTVVIEPIFEKVVVPETGDGANPVLWIALIAISAAGMAMMLRRKKEA